MSDKMRAEFESWLSDNGLLALKEESGEYSFQHTRCAWRAWQASSAALVVELLPQLEEGFIDSYKEGWNDAIDSCRVSFESVGATCK